MQYMHAYGLCGTRNGTNKNTGNKSSALENKLQSINTIDSGDRTSSVIAKQCRMWPHTVGTNVHAPCTTSYGALWPKNIRVAYKAERRMMNLHGYSTPLYDTIEREIPTACSSKKKGRDRWTMNAGL